MQGTGVTPHGARLQDLSPFMFAPIALWLSNAFTTIQIQQIQRQQPA